MDEIARDHRDQRDQHEGGIGRPAVERDAGQEVVHQMEGRRIGAERVEQHQRRGDGEEPDLARPGDAADKAEGHQHDDGQRAGIDETHVLREIEPRPAPGGVPDQALRHPIVDGRVHRAEEIGEGELQEVDGWIEPAAAEAKLISGRFERAASSVVMITGMAATSAALAPAAASGSRLARRRARRRSPASQMRQHESGEHIEREQRDLVAPDRDQPGERARRQARAPRRALERARQQPQRERQIGEADDLAGMLDARAGGAAERERQRRHQRAARCQPRSRKNRMMPSPPRNR